MFQLSAEEKTELIAECDHLKTPKTSKAFPFAFNEHGAIMRAKVLGSDVRGRVPEPHGA